MNRLVLIGNGFDLAHGLKTSYEDYINWYWEDWGRKLLQGPSKVETDGLCTFKIREEKGAGIPNWAAAFQGWYYRRKDILTPWDYNEVVTLAKEDSTFCEFSTSPFLQKICNNIESKGWVDIENEYYELLKKYALDDNNEVKVKELNKQLLFIKDKLVEYLNLIDPKEVKTIESIKSAIYSPFNTRDISIGGMPALQEHFEGGLTLPIEEWEMKLRRYGCTDIPAKLNAIKKTKEKLLVSSWLFGKCVVKFKELFSHMKNISALGASSDILFSPSEFLLPNNLMLLNFNYTKTAEQYCRPKEILETPLSPINQIHGIAMEPENVIFGYGDEMDEEYKELVNKNDNQYLGNIKSIKYLETLNYRKVLHFIESGPYQILIMGHSCGNSDRTLLNTLFEHKNCVSIKPYYYKKEDGTDNYLELIENISRNFTDMKLMRDRVVNKSFCELLTKGE